MTEPRVSLDDLTSDQLDQLYNRAEQAEAEVRDLREEIRTATIARTDAERARDRHRWYADDAGRQCGLQRTRAEDAEAANDRVRQLHRKASHGDTCVYCAHGQRLGYDTTWPCDTIRALDQAQQPTTTEGIAPHAQAAADAAPRPTLAEVYLATPCDACAHTLNWHDNKIGCTVRLCVCGQFQQPTT
ncbi:hypothetical protein [Streptomyces sp. NBC_00338]|uniref:hypothetical protein n=1 Tax=Streptomyces sp. NBC_00338 TaxID=2975715 RepID=UPI002259960B|nr:hypothetical protein [Streptomyces sp. NBC_00338]MCX5138347.1 hypothetical protein [Streptomyces sp. NBC_00338]MCX5145136.1 hypothetical protein [Streptomyces sp. NBC_00338]